MSPRPAPALPSEPVVRPSVRIARVCELLDVDDSQVRRLIDSGELQGHRQGKRGIRVYLDSVTAYQEGRPLTPSARGKEPPPRKPPNRASAAAHEAAMARLRGLGLV